MGTLLIGSTLHKLSNIMSIAQLVKQHLGVKPEDQFWIISISDDDVTYSWNGVMHTFSFC